MQLDFFWLLFCLVFKNHSLHLSKAKLTCPKKKRAVLWVSAQSMHGCH